MNRCLIATAAVLVGLIAAALPGVSANAAASGYPRQAVRAGLSPSQAAYVQHKIDSVLAANTSARQLSANTVQIDGRPLVIGAPGQHSVHAIGMPAAASAGRCPANYLCTYHNGKAINYYHCGIVYLSGWTGEGYVFNNQTSGTKSVFYKLNGSVYFSDTAKDLVNRDTNWNPIWSFRVC